MTIRFHLSCIESLVNAPKNIQTDFENNFRDYLILCLEPNYWCT